jgi:hypothetical protein
MDKCGDFLYEILFHVKAVGGVANKEKGGR